MNEFPLRKALDSAYRYLARSPRSRVEVERRLRQKKFPDSVIRQVLKKLEANRYLDDRSLARQWARDRLARRHWGPLRLRMELKRKGIAREWTEEAIRDLFEARDEIQYAKDLVAHRLKGRDLRDPKEVRRLFAYLTRRGYSPEVIQTVMRNTDAGRGA